MKAWSGEKMLVVGWKDKQVRPTILVSTVCSSETNSRDPNRPAVDKPVVVHQCNQCNQSINGGGGWTRLTNTAYITASNASQ